MIEILIEKITSFALGAGIKLVVSGLLLLIGFRLIKALTARMKRGRGFRHADPSVKSFTISFVNIALKVVLVITVAAYLGVPMTSMIAVLGSAGVAVGLALQGGLSNIAGGIMILIFRPFSVDDFIDCGENSGTVISISIFYTTLRTADGRRIVIPNSTITGGTVVNYSVEKLRRVDLEFTAAYNADAAQVKQLLLDAALAQEKVLSDPAPMTAMSEHGDSAIKYILRVWCERTDYWDVRFALIEDVKRRFDTAGIEIPFPQVDVHIEKTLQ